MGDSMNGATVVHPKGQAHRPTHDEKSQANFTHNTRPPTFHQRACADKRGISLRTRAKVTLARAGGVDAMLPEQRRGLDRLVLTYHAKFPRAPSRQDFSYFCRALSCFLDVYTILAKVRTSHRS